MYYDLFWFMMPGLDFLLDSSQAQDSQNLVVERREERNVAPVTMNAFELISTSQGLNLNSLFEKQMVWLNLKNKRKIVICRTLLVFCLLNWQVLTFPL